MAATYKGVVATTAGGELEPNTAVATVAGPAGDGPAAKWLRIAPTHVALNPVDWKMPVVGFFLPELPQVLGCDFAGVVTAVGDGAETEFAVGDAVYGYVPIDAASGTFQDVFDAPAALTFPVSDGQSPAEVATLPVALVTAVAGVFWEQADSGAGHTLAKGAVTDDTPFLVWGGSSSVGQAAIQILSAVGFRVITTASAKHHERLAALGAAVVVDYNADDADAQIRAAADGKPLRYAFDTISVATGVRSAGLLDATADAPAYLTSVSPGVWGDVVLPDNVVLTEVLIAGWSKNADAVAWTERVHDTVASFLPLVPNTVTDIGSTWEDVRGALATLQAGVSGTKLVATLAADPADR